ncbi:MAG: hypothetical protein WD049_08030 [Candidatus Paceibacterota bacterium]
MAYTLRRLIQPGEWVLIASGAVMVVGAVAMHIGQEFYVEFWFAAKVLYGIGVVLIVYKLFRNTS